MWQCLLGVQRPSARRQSGRNSRAGLPPELSDVFRTQLSRGPRGSHTALHSPLRPQGLDSELRSTQAGPLLVPSAFLGLLPPRQEHSDPPDEYPQAPLNLPGEALGPTPLPVKWFFLPKASNRCVWNVPNLIHHRCLYPRFLQSSKVLYRLLPLGYLPFLFIYLIF